MQTVENGRPGKWIVACAIVALLGAPFVRWMPERGEAGTASAPDAGSDPV